MIYMTDSNGNLIPFASDNQGNANTLLRYVIETYQNGTEGYIIYNDGWCEQWGLLTGGGNTSVQYIKEFADTNYNLLVTNNSPTSYGNGIPLRQDGYTTKTTTGFNAYADGNLYKNWRAFGYLADGEYIYENRLTNSSGNPYLVDSWESSDHKSFYRIYSDGFKECGGYIARQSYNATYQQAFPIQFNNIPNVQMTRANLQSSTTLLWNYYTVNNITTQNFTTAINTDYDTYWIAKGY